MAVWPMTEGIDPCKDMSFIDKVEKYIMPNNKFITKSST